MEDAGSQRPARTASGLASRRGAITGGLAAALSWLVLAGAETLPPVFWASWCPACRIELPVLDRLSERARKMRLNVVAVSEDRGGRDQVSRFVQSLGIRNLPIYLDPHGHVGHTDPDRTKAPFALYGMPITYLIARSGWIVGYMPGAADWTEPAAEVLVEYLRNV
jgi:thiol-disulfide isomerase/thioredoxin